MARKTSSHLLVSLDPLDLFAWAIYSLKLACISKIYWFEVLSGPLSPLPLFILSHQICFISFQTWASCGSTYTQTHNPNTQTHRLHNWFGTVLSPSAHWSAATLFFFFFFSLFLSLFLCNLVFFALLLMLTHSFLTPKKTQQTKANQVKNLTLNLKAQLSRTSFPLFFSFCPVF